MSDEGKYIKINDLKPIRSKRIKPKYKSTKYKLELSNLKIKKLRTLAILVILVLTGYLLYSSPLYTTLRLASHLRNKKILVGFQNSAELRPTGGFWGSFGIWQINKNILDSTLYFETNPYKKDNPLLIKGSQTLPKPLAETYSNRPQSFVNANWEADFQDAAKNLEWYLAEGWEEKVDGTIAISSLAIIDLLKEIGPIEVEGELVTADNFSQIMSQKIDTEYWLKEENKVINEPKTVLKDLAPELISESRKLGVIKLTRFYFDQIEKGRMQLYFSDKNNKKLAQKIKASGELINTSKDYLHINNANINGGKSSLNIYQSVNYRVQFQDHPISNLLITREMDGRWPNILNRNYTRVFTPLGSVLISAKINGEDITGSVDTTQENSRSVFGFWFSVAPNSSQQAELVYQLPFDSNSLKNYDIVYQKQPGTMPENLTISIQGGESFFAKIDQSLTRFKTGIK